MFSFIHYTTQAPVDGCPEGPVVVNRGNPRGDYSPGMIASEGQTSAQEPHSMQVSGSMW